MKLKKTPIFDLAGCCGYACPSKGIEIVECEKALADSVIVPNHYSHKAVSNSCINLVVLYHGKVEGALQIGYGIRPKIKGDLDPENTREFDRMWLSDKMPKYSETITLSLLTHYLRMRHPEIKHLISYADTSAGKTGTMKVERQTRIFSNLKENKMNDNQVKKCSGCAFADFRFNDAPAGSGYSTFLCTRHHKFRNYGDADCGEWEDRHKEADK